MQKTMTVMAMAASAALAENDDKNCLLPHAFDVRDIYMNAVGDKEGSVIVVKGKEACMVEGPWGITPLNIPKMEKPYMNKLASYLDCLPNAFDFKGVDYFTRKDCKVLVGLLEKDPFRGESDVEKVVYHLESLNEATNELKLVDGNGDKPKGRIYLPKEDHL